MRRKGDQKRVLLALCVVGVVMTFCIAACTGRPGEETDVENKTNASSASIPRMELKVTKDGERLEGTFDGLAAGEAKGYLVVKNDSDETVAFSAKFSHQNAEGEKLGTHADGYAAVAPGDSALLYDRIRDPSVAHVDYEVTCKAVDAGSLPIGKGITVKESAVDEGEVALTITNATKNAVRIKDLRVEAVDKDRVRRLGRTLGIAHLEPGTNGTVKLDATQVFGGEGLGSWNELKRTYYINGYAEERDEDNEGESKPGDAEHVPSASLSVHEVGEKLTGNLEGSAPSGVKAYLLVKNETADPVALRATFGFKRASGKSASGFDDWADIVSPGETAMLCAKCHEKGVTSVDYELQCEKAEDWAKPLSEILNVTEVSSDDATVTIRITNKGAQRAFISSRRCVAKDADGRTHAADEFSQSNLDPGESLDVTFSKSSMFDPDAFYTWEGLERTYYIGGHTT